MCMCIVGFKDRAMPAVVLLQMLLFGKKYFLIRKQNWRLKYLANMKPFHTIKGTQRKENYVDSDFSIIVALILQVYNGSKEEHLLCGF